MQNNENLTYWKDKFEEAQTEYRGVTENLVKWWKQYTGERDKETVGTDKTYSDDNGTFPLVRNFTYELIESQVDSSIPQPKVTSPTRDKRKMRNARVIEAMLKGVMKKMPLPAMNDKEERMVKSLGGVGRIVFWDNFAGRSGEVGVNVLSPMQIIPQPGVYEIKDMDYIFVTREETKNKLNDIYSVDIDEWEMDSATLNDELFDASENAKEVITQITVYYRNENGRLGVFSWAGNCVLIDNDDYNARSEYVCANCGRSKPVTDDKCVCGNDKWQRRTKDFEEIDSDYYFERDERGEPIQQDEKGNPTEYVPSKTYDVIGNIQDEGFNTSMISGSISDNGDYYGMRPTKIPYYVPSVFPVMLRRNVSVYGQFLGDSDCDKIRDMQIQHNNLAIKVQEKMFKGGSVLTLPKGVRIETSDRELKLVYIDSPAQKNMIDVVNLQANVQQDIQMLEKYYQDAKSTLGINDSYQGKQDATATSGRAKEAQINQAQGRLESKSAMKWQSYVEMFRAIFQYMLAYSDEPIDFVGQSEDGKEETFTFNRYDFLVRMPSGEWEYDDDYLFDVDSAGGLMQNRQNMWAEIRQNFQSGAYGSPQDPRTLIMFWSQMEDADYPNAGAVVKQLKEIEQQAQQAAQQAQMQAQQQAIQKQEQKSGQAPQQPDNKLNDVNNILAQADEFLKNN